MLINFLISNSDFGSKSKWLLKVWGLLVCFMACVSGKPLPKTMPETWLSLCTSHCYAPAGSSSQGHIKVHSIKALAVAGVCLRSLPSLGICRALPEVICIILCHLSALILCSKDFREANLYPVCLCPMMIFSFWHIATIFVHPLVSLSSFSLSHDLYVMCVVIFMLVVIIRFHILLLMWLCACSHGKLCLYFWDNL